MQYMKTMKRLSLILFCLTVCSVMMARRGDERIHYDKESDLKGITMEPRLISMNEDYTPMDYGTWPYYEAPGTISIRDGIQMARYAFWFTKKATYMFSISRLHWDTMYFMENSTGYIRDSKTGK